MKRKCFIYKTLNGKHICVDIENAEDIITLITKNKQYEKRFLYVIGRILESQNRFYKDYQQIRPGVTEMRFFATGFNGRVYCREMTVGRESFCIIMAKALPKKKSQKIDKAIEQIINSISQYEYEID